MGNRRLGPNYSRLPDWGCLDCGVL